MAKKAQNSTTNEGGLVKSNVLDEMKHTRQQSLANVNLGTEAAAIIKQNEEERLIQKVYNITTRTESLLDLLPALVKSMKPDEGGGNKLQEDGTFTKLPKDVWSDKAAQRRTDLVVAHNELDEAFTKAMMSATDENLKVKQEELWDAVEKSLEKGEKLVKNASK